MLNSDLNNKIQPPEAPKSPQSNQIVKPRKPQLAEINSRLLIKRLDRILVIDGKPVNLLGFYEAVPGTAKENSGFTMQVNQVGLSLVGWISETPSVVTNKTPIKTLPKLPGNLPLRFAVFCSTLTSNPQIKAAAGVYLIPFQMKIISSPPGNMINTFDFKIWGEQTGIDLDGKMRLEYIPDPDYTYLGVQLKSLGFRETRNWQITGINFGGLPYDIIRQIEIIHFENTVADPKQKDMLRDALIASHVCIIPESHILKILRIATKLFIYGPMGKEEDIPPETEAALEEWLKAPDSPAQTRRIARTKVLDNLLRMHHEIANLPYAFHREIVCDLFKSNANKIEKGDQSYYELYVQILDEEFRDHPNSAENYLDSILRLGIFPMISGGKSFRYTLTFSPLPFLNLTKLKLPVNAGASTLEILCEIVEFELDSKGRKKIDRISGNAVVKNIVKPSVYDTSTQSGGPKQLAITGTFGIAPTTIPSKVELFSHNDLKYEDFIDATFSFVWIQGTPEIKIGPYVEIKSLATGFFDVTLPKKNNMGLWGSVTQLPGIEMKIAGEGKKTAEAFTTTPKSFGDVQKKGTVVKPYVEDIYKKGPESAAESWLDSLRLKNLKEQFKSIIGVTVGTGKFISATSFRTPTINNNDTPTLSKDTHVLESARIASFFEHDSSDFSKVVQRFGEPSHEAVWNTTSRDLLELFLAINLSMVMNQEAKIYLTGHASPEGPIGPQPNGQYDPYNLELSQERTDSVFYAILDAMKIFPTDAWASIDNDCKGEAESREPVTRGGGGLSDPPGTNDPGAFLSWLKNRKNQREVEQWPNWRRVDVNIIGVALLQLHD
jgi:hypothetical protein